MKNSELKPCPFCGEKPKVVEDISVSWVVCDNERCMVYARTLLKKTREEAIEAWNTRAERTCENLSSGSLFICSECNGQVTQWRVAPNYCPCCGAKVIGD